MSDFSGCRSKSEQGLGFNINFGTIWVNSVTQAELAEPLGFCDRHEDNGYSKNSFLTSSEKEEWDVPAPGDLGSHVLSQKRVWGFGVLDPCVLALKSWSAHTSQFYLRHFTLELRNQTWWAYLQHGKLANTSKGSPAPTPRAIYQPASGLTAKWMF